MPTTLTTCCTFAYPYPIPNLAGGKQKTASLEAIRRSQFKAIKKYQQLNELKKTLILIPKKDYKDEIEQARYEYNLKLIKLRKEAKDNPPNPAHYASKEAARINNARLQRIKEAELRSDLDGFTSKCRKKAGYKYQPSITLEFWLQGLVDNKTLSKEDKENWLRLNDLVLEALKVDDFESFDN